MEKAISEPVRVLRVLLTGSAGFIGQVALAALENKGYEVIPFDIQTDPDQDVADRECLKPLRYDAVVHLAAVSSTPWARMKPSKAFTVNVQGTYNVLLDALNKGVKRVVIASSSRLDLMPLDNPYVVSKYLAEAIALAFQEQFRAQMGILLLRFASVYGPGNFEKAHSLNILNQIVKAAVTGEKVVIFGDGQQERDFIYVDDVATVLAEVVGDTYGVGIWQLGRGEQTDLATAVRLVEAISEKPVHVEHTGSYPSDYMMHQPMNNSFSRRYLRQGYTDIKEGIRQCVQSYSDRVSTSG